MGKVSARESKQIVLLYKAGFWLKEIAEKYGITRAAVLYHLRKNGIKPHGKWSRKRLTVSAPIEQIQWISEDG